MLVLKRNRYFNELYKCGISNELIGYGDWYYQDTDDGLIVKATVYKRIKQEQEEKQFDYTKLNQLMSQRDYREALKEATREINYMDLLNRKVLDNTTTLSED